MGAWQNGEWRIVISVPRRQEKFTFEEGVQVPLGFAVWDGSRDERNGQKAYSQWQNIQLGSAVVPGATPVAPPAEGGGGGGILVPLVGGVGGVAAAAVAAVIGLRMWRSRNGKEQGES